MSRKTPGDKHDSGKLLYHLLPVKPVQEIVKVLMFGAKKYSEDNWQLVDDPVIRYGNALKRHIDTWDYGRGESYDPETKLHHLAHAGCCILFLLYFCVTKNIGSAYSKKTDKKR